MTPDSPSNHQSETIAVPFSTSHFSPNHNFDNITGHCSISSFPSNHNSNTNNTVTDHLSTSGLSSNHNCITLAGHCSISGHLSNHNPATINDHCPISGLPTNYHTGNLTGHFSNSEPNTNSVHGSTSNSKTINVHSSASDHNSVHCLASDLSQHFINKDPQKALPTQIYQHQTQIINPVTNIDNLPYGITTNLIGTPPDGATENIVTPPDGTTENFDTSLDDNQLREFLEDLKETPFPDLIHILDTNEITGRTPTFKYHNFVEQVKVRFKTYLDATEEEVDYPSDCIQKVELEVSVVMGLTMPKAMIPFVCVSVCMHICITSRRV